MWDRLGRRKSDRRAKKNTDLIKVKYALPAMWVIILDLCINPYFLSVLSSGEPPPRAVPSFALRRPTFPSHPTDFPIYLPTYLPTYLPALRGIILGTSARSFIILTRELPFFLSEPELPQIEGEADSVSRSRFAFFPLLSLSLHRARKFFL